MIIEMLYTDKAVDKRNFGSLHKKPMLMEIWYKDKAEDKGNSVYRKAEAKRKFVNRQSRG